jgi:hypothetical protein
MKQIQWCCSFRLYVMFDRDTVLLRFGADELAPTRPVRARSAAYNRALMVLQSIDRLCIGEQMQDEMYIAAVAPCAERRSLPAAGCAALALLSRQLRCRCTLHAHCCNAMRCNLCIASHCSIRGRMRRRCTEQHSCSSASAERRLLADDLASNALCSRPPSLCHFFARW